MGTGAGVQTNVCSWFVRGTKERQGAQIFSIDNDYAKVLQNKLDAYRELSKDKRTLHLVMVTTNGVYRKMRMLQCETSSFMYYLSVRISQQRA